MNTNESSQNISVVRKLTSHYRQKVTGNVSFQNNKRNGGAFKTPPLFFLKCSCRYHQHKGAVLYGTEYVLHQGQKSCYLCQHQQQLCLFSKKYKNV